jgi:hypothetical protein
VRRRVTFFAHNDPDKQFRNSSGWFGARPATLADPVNAFIQRPQSVLLRRALFQVHLCVGVASGLYIFIVGVTGAALVFRIDLQRASYPQLFTSSAAGPAADPVTILEHVRDAYPNGRVSGIDAPTTSRRSWSIPSRPECLANFPRDRSCGRCRICISICSPGGRVGW